MKKLVSRSMREANHRADALNKNIGTPGTNITNAKVHGNRGKQMDPRRQQSSTKLPVIQTTKASGK